MNEHTILPDPLQIDIIAAVGCLVKIIKARIDRDNLVFKQRVDNILIRLIKIFAFLEI